MLHFWEGQKAKSYFRSCTHKSSCAWKHTHNHTWVRRTFYFPTRYTTIKFRNIAYKNYTLCIYKNYKTNHIKYIASFFFLSLPSLQSTIIRIIIHTRTRLMNRSSSSIIASHHKNVNKAIEIILIIEH